MCLQASHSVADLDGVQVQAVSSVQDCCVRGPFFSETTGRQQGVTVGTTCGSSALTPLLALLSVLWQLCFPFWEMPHPLYIQLAAGWGSSEGTAIEDLSQPWWWGQRREHNETSGHGSEIQE